MSDFKIGQKVTFRAGPKSTSNTTGTVKKVLPAGSGRGNSAFLLVGCDDGKDRKVRPGAAKAA